MYLSTSGETEICGKGVPFRSDEEHMAEDKQGDSVSSRHGSRRVGAGFDLLTHGGEDATDEFGVEKVSPTKESSFPSFLQPHDDEIDMR